MRAALSGGSLRAIVLVAALGVLTCNTHRASAHGGAGCADRAPRYRDRERYPHAGEPDLARRRARSGRCRRLPGRRRSDQLVCRRRPGDLHQHRADRASGKPEPADRRHRARDRTHRRRAYPAPRRRRCATPASRPSSRWCSGRRPRSPGTAARRCSARWGSASVRFLHFSIAQEATADHAALNFLDRACLSARGLLKFFEILQSDELLSAIAR